jgi:hypothetical protein
MEDFDANEDVVRLPGAGHSGRVVHGRPRLLLDYLDVFVVVLATFPALALGAPVFGYCVGAGAWLAQRALAEVDKRWIRKASQPRTQLGLSLFESFGRIWLLAGAIIIAGVVGGRADGLTAALVIFGAYSVAFAVKLLSGRPAPRRSGELSL